MELTNEQLKQIVRFVDGEMTDAEGEAFTVDLDRNKQLNDEAVFYKKIRSVIEAIDRVISTVNARPGAGKSSYNNITALIRQARNYLETHFDVFSMRNKCSSIEVSGILTKSNGCFKINETPKEILEEENKTIIV